MTHFDKTKSNRILTWARHLGYTLDPDHPPIIYCGDCRSRILVQEGEDSDSWVVEKGAKKMRRGKAVYWLCPKCFTDWQTKQAEETKKLENEALNGLIQSFVPFFYNKERIDSSNLYHSSLIKMAQSFYEKEGEPLFGSRMRSESVEVEIRNYVSFQRNQCNFVDGEWQAVAHISANRAFEKGYNWGIGGKSFEQLEPLVGSLDEVSKVLSDNGLVATTTVEQIGVKPHGPLMFDTTHDIDIKGGSSDFSFVPCSLDLGVKNSPNTYPKHSMYLLTVIYETALEAGWGAGYRAWTKEAGVSEDSQVGEDEGQDEEDLLADYYPKENDESTILTAKKLGFYENESGEWFCPHGLPVRGEVKCEKCEEEDESKKKDGLKAPDDSAGPKIPE